MQNKPVPETLSWKAPSHIQHRRSSGWYLIFALVGLGLIAFSLYIQSITASITFFLVLMVLLIVNTQQSREVTNKITKTGIVSGEVVYPFKIIKRFWILYNPPEVKTLNFETTAYINNRVVIQIANQDPVVLKLVLSEYIPEDIEMEETVTESLARKLKI
jgi:hypothetical protein